MVKVEIEEYTPITGHKTLPGSLVGISKDGQWIVEDDIEGILWTRDWHEVKIIDPNITNQSLAKQIADHRLALSLLTSVEQSLTQRT